MRKQLGRSQSPQRQSMLLSSSLIDDNSSLIEEAKRNLQREKEVLNRRSLEIDQDSEGDSEHESTSDNDDVDKELNYELITLTNDIDMKQKLIDELELSQRRMQTMRQHYEDKLMQLQLRIQNTQEERDKVLHKYSSHSEPSDKIKKIKEDYTIHKKNQRHAKRTQKTSSRAKRTCQIGQEP